MPSFVFAVLLKCSFIVLGGYFYFYISLNPVAVFLCLNLARFHDSSFKYVVNVCFCLLNVTKGFIMMTPQLFINYKLKSVAHLPWRMMTYKALNTFIDDLFAFVIKMPTLYRIGCFRDGKCLLVHLS